MADNNKQSILAAIDDAKHRVSALTDRFIEGDIDEDQWAEDMQGEIRSGHRAMFAAIFGVAIVGLALTRLAEITQAQLDYFEAFAAGVKDGEIEKTAGLGSRAEKYMDAMWASYQSAGRVDALEQGMTHATWNLEARAQHCDECPEQADRGMQLIEKFPDVGSLECQVGCRCWLEYSKE